MLGIFDLFFFSNSLHRYRGGGGGGANAKHNVVTYFGKIITYI